MTRQYVRHRWITTGPRSAECIACGIKESTWERLIRNAPMIEHDCKAVQDRKPWRRPK